MGQPGIGPVGMSLSAEAGEDDFRTRLASAWPWVAFITAPTSAPAAATLPSRIFWATSGLGGDRLIHRGGQRRVVADHGEAAAGLTTSSGVPSPASTPSMTCRASRSLSAPGVDQRGYPGHVGRA